MALPKRKDRKSFDPVVKFNAKEGKFVRCDRVEGENGWETKEHEVAADEFQAIVDLDNIQVGWIAYTTSGPDMRLVGTDEDIGDRPSDAFKEGFRLRMKLQNGAGDDIRELSSTAIGLWNSIDELHSEFVEGRSKHKGKLPLVGVTEIARVSTKNGVTYRPIFEIAKWVARPSDL
jgi:hypothetical protein